MSSLSAAVPSTAPVVPVRTSSGTSQTSQPASNGTDLQASPSESTRPSAATAGSCDANS
jgi:hypothetical protein